MMSYGDIITLLLLLLPLLLLLLLLLAASVHRCICAHIDATRNYAGSCHAPRLPTPSPHKQPQEVLTQSATVCAPASKA
jgi:hypothetical protein